MVEKKQYFDLVVTEEVATALGDPSLAGEFLSVHIDVWLRLIEEESWAQTHWPQDEDGNRESSLEDFVNGRC